MKNFFPNCIFCFNELNEKEKKGRGDHIIPLSLSGSISIKDVCRNCNSLLGRTADSSAIEDQRIISAVRQLDLPNIDNAIKDRAVGISIDPETGQEVPVKFKRGEPVITPTLQDDGSLIVDQNEAPYHLSRIYHRQSLPQLTQEEVEQIFGTPPGHVLDFPERQTTLRTGSGKIQFTPKISEGACERLIAKIGYEIGFLMFRRDLLRDIMSTMLLLAKVAFGQGRLRPDILMYPSDQYSPVNSHPRGPKYHHQIIVRYLERHIAIDIYFFGCVGFRLCLRGSTRELHGPIPDGDGPLDLVSLIMTFEPDKPRSKLMALQRSGEDRPTMFDASMIL